MNRFKPDVLIYVQNVADFFLKNVQEFSSIFGTLKLEDCIREIANVAEENYGKIGDATLTKEQFIEIKHKLEFSRLFVPTTFGFFCLN